MREVFVARKKKKLEKLLESILTSSDPDVLMTGVIHEKINQWYESIRTEMKRRKQKKR